MEKSAQDLLRGVVTRFKISPCIADKVEIGKKDTSHLKFGDFPSFNHPPTLARNGTGSCPQWDAARGHGRGRGG